MKRISYFAVSLLLITAGSTSFHAHANEIMPTVPRRIERTQPDDTALQITSERQRELDAVEREIREKRRAFEAGQPPATQETARTQPTLPKGSASQTSTSIKAQGASQSARRGVNSRSSLRRRQSAPKQAFSQGGAFSRSLGPVGGGFRAGMGSPLQVFTVSKNAEPADESYTVLPTGSHVKARVVSGVEANAREPYPVLLQLDYAFTGPNKTRIDLSQCFMIAKARANMSTERVMMETESLSCVREDGEHFKRDAKGFVAGSDNTFGATGTYISKQGQVLLSAVLASIAKNAGQAIADAQKTTSILGSDKAATAANITGDKVAFVGGSALVDGASLVAQWYLEQAKELLPSIGVGSGQDVFVVMLDTIKIPQLSSQE
ncbi:MAG: hypothetical protein RL189_3115 [Pseudomonadota bacterium]